ncbi:peptidoglycan DD-metalloendopeptidase family protein [Candidatus Bathyarchaeota archaeon]|nr:peptidoglycan DD-metalloendopeptidase family protein [Candidatus Bathyarchaeota archaeon]
MKKNNVFKANAARIHKRMAIAAWFVLFLTISIIAESTVFSISPTGSGETAKVLVDPEINYIPLLNDTFTISVKIVNVTGLYAFEIQFTWNPEFIRHVSHAVKVPVENYPGGVLHKGSLGIQELAYQLDENASIPRTEPGTRYWVAYSSKGEAESFSGSGTVFEMTFRVVGEGYCPLEILFSELSDKDAQPIYHEVMNGLFYTHEYSFGFRYPLDEHWTISQRFGRWNTDWQGYHLGEDVLRSFEAPVYAPANGVVKHNAKRTGYGYVVIIEHQLMDGTSVCSVLGHLREAGRIPVGATVAKGQIVGYLSSVPEENGGIIHLHFGIRKGMYSEELDFDGKWRYRGYGPAAIVDYWHPPSQFIDYYNIQKTPALPEEEGLRVTITSDKTFYQLDETINFNVTVTNPTNETGINIVAHNSSLIIEPPAEIELENPQTFHDLGDINPGESKTLSFTAIAKKVGALLKTWAKAAGEDLQLGLSMAGACLKQLFIGNTIPTEWSFAVITDLHIGRPGCSEVEGRLREAVSAINLALKDEHNIKFVLVLGDITDLGGEHFNSDFVKAREILNLLNDPNQDGNMEDGVPYIPLIGNHDIKKDGEQYSGPTFWGSGNDRNQQLIEATVDDETFDLQDQDSLYLQNCYFSYDGLDFLCLDFAARDLIAEIDPTGVYPIRTREFLQNYFGLNSGESFVLASHFPLYEFGGFPPQFMLEGDIDAHDCNVTNFAGHTHRNYDTWWSDRFRVIETEAVAQVEYDVIWDFPKPIVTGSTIRIVTVKDGEIDDYSTLENPEKVLEEYRVFWEHIAFLTVEGFGSYFEPNKPAIFTAYYPAHHGFETSFQWTFDDGDCGSGVTVSHSYLQEGDYNVALNITRRNLITNETITETIYRKLCVRTKHTISPLPANSYAISLISAVDLTKVPTNMHFPVLIGKNSTDGENPVAIIGVHFENADANIDFSNLVLDTDTTTKKSIVFSSSWPLEADCGKWLFVPSSGAGSVYICLNATTLNDVKLENADFVVNDGETVNNISLAITYHNGKEYYLVYGNVTGFGGGEIFHDITVANFTVSKTLVGEGFSLHVNVTVQNQDPFTETFNATIYANTTIIGSINVTLASGTSSIITFTWDTTGFAYGNYTISAYAWPVQGETNTVDNTFVAGVVIVTIPGDVDGDLENGHYDVDLFDAVKLLAYYGAKEGDPNFDPNCDIDNCGQVFLFDAVILLSRYGQKYP